MHKGSKDGRYKLPALDNAINKCSKTIFYYRLVIVIALLIVAALFIINLSNKKDFEPYKDSALLLTCSSIIIGIFYTIINYEHNYYKSKNDNRLSKKNLVLTIAFEWSRPSIVEHLKVVNKFKIANAELIKNATTPQFAKALDEDDTARTSFVIVFNFLETIALGVENEILDEDFAHKCFGTVFREKYRDYGFYILHRRRINNSQTTWKVFTDVAIRWESTPPII
jgi:Domain of unknown function (DUF4760)